MPKNLNYFISKYKDSISKLVQVGAHFGQEIDIFEQYEIDKIYLFEPLQEAHVELEKKIKNKSKYELFKFALGNEPETKKMFYSNENKGQSSSFLKPELHKKIQPKIEFDNNLTIKIEKFDNLNIDFVDFLILDVQGFELEVLKGFSNKLNNVKFIFSEINRDLLYEENVLFRDLDKYLMNFGFIRLWTSWRPADMPWGDAFYIKKDILNIYQLAIKKITNFLSSNKLFFLIYRLIDFRVHKKILKRILFSKQ